MGRQPRSGLNLERRRRRPRSLSEKLNNPLHIVVSDVAVPRPIVCRGRFRHFSGKLLRVELAITWLDAEGELLQTFYLLFYSPTEITEATRLNCEEPEALVASDSKARSVVSV